MIQRRTVLGMLGCQGVAFILLLILIIGFHVARHTTVETRSCGITAKESVSLPDGHQYRVHTSQCGTLTVQDDLASFHFSSADLYGSLIEGQRYEVTTRGMRLPWLSSFPNIVEARPAP